MRLLIPFVLSLVSLLLFFGCCCVVGYVYVAKYTGARQAALATVSVGGTDPCPDCLSHVRLFFNGSAQSGIAAIDLSRRSDGAIEPVRISSWITADRFMS